MTAPRDGGAVDGSFDAAAETAAERSDLAEYLAGLEPASWTTPSLCAGWVVADVVAHLSLATDTTWPQFLSLMVRARFDFDRMEAEAARRRAAERTPDELVELLRVGATTNRRAPGSGPLDPLLDLLVHGQDIARPLGHERPVPLRRAIPALDHAIASRWYGARRRLAGLRLEATDAPWTHGEGPDRVAGAVGDLLLVATGRPAGLGGLTGSGTDALRGRLSPA